MKQSRTLTTLAVLGLAVSILLPASTATAAPAPVSAKIYITAIVLPKRTIIVNEASQIVEIASNTEQDIQPDVYAGKPGLYNKKALTPEIYEAYRKIVPKGTAQAGILYQQSTATAQPGPAPNNDLFTKD